MVVLTFSLPFQKQPKSIPLFLLSSYLNQCCMCLTAHTTAPVNNLTWSTTPNSHTGAVSHTHTPHRPLFFFNEHPARQKPIVQPTNHVTPRGGHSPGRLTRSHPSSSASLTHGLGPLSSAETSSTSPKSRLLSRWNISRPVGGDKGVKLVLDDVDV